MEGGGDAIVAKEGIVDGIEKILGFVGSENENDIFGLVDGIQETSPIFFGGIVAKAHFLVCFGFVCFGFIVFFFFTKQEFVQFIENNDKGSFFAGLYIMN